MKTDNKIMETDYRIQVLNHFYFIKQDADWYNYRDALPSEIECWCERKELKIPKIDDLPFSLNSDIKELSHLFNEGFDGKPTDISCMENCVIINKYNTNWLFDLFIEDIDMALNRWFSVNRKLFLD